MIEITNEERQVFYMILSCTSNYIKARVAGGWVRDKLMGKSSYDMDIALENISGYDFAKMLYHKYKDSMSNVSVVQSNPDKSKHLETAVCRINNIQLDFVNLRSEKYTETRVPVIQNGTPIEDAYRRDLTINSLFYNLHTNSIEDHTRLGMDDIQNKIIRTPLEPLTTFSDDPLRILRVFRFRAKLQFTLSDDICAVIDSIDLKTQLKKKISRERINIEIYKMVEYENGYIGILDIVKYGYVEPIFGLPYNKGSLDENCQKFINFYKEHLVTDKRWIYNLYMILLPFSGKMTKSKDKNVFLNYEVCVSNLVSSCKISNVIKEIEEGLYKISLLDITKIEKYNVLLIIYTLGQHWETVLNLLYLQTSNMEVKRLLHFANNSKLAFKNIKPILEMKGIHLRLGIEKKHISYFVKECIVYQQSNPDSDVMSFLVRHKDVIINKHKRLDSSNIYKSA